MLYLLCVLMSNLENYIWDLGSNACQALNLLDKLKKTWLLSLGVPYDLSGRRNKRCLLSPLLVPCRMKLTWVICPIVKAL